MDLDIHPKITVLAGLNGEGKSSTVLALRALLLSKAQILPIDKKDAQRFVHDGMKAGELRFITDTGERLIKYPECDVIPDGAPPKANEWAVGPAKLMQVDEKTRGNALIELLEAQPTREQLDEALSETAKMPEETRKAICDYVFGTMKDPKRGFDGACEWQKDTAKQIKGKYEAKTGTKWFPKKALTWTPPNWEMDLEKRTREELEKAIVDAKGVHELTVSINAVSAAKRAELQAQADKLPELRSQSDKAKLEREEKRKAYEELLEVKLTPVPGPAEVHKKHECPECGVFVVLENDRLVIATEAKGISLEELRALTDEHSKHKAAQAAALAALEESSAAHRKIDDQLYAADRAANELAMLAEAPENAVDAESVVSARNQVARAEQRLRVWEAWDQGRHIHNEIVQTLAAADVLAPDGLRHACLVKKLAGFNQILETIWGAAKTYKRIEILPTLDATYGGRHYIDLSDGEQYRVDAVLAIAFAKMEKQPLLIFDKAEVMDKNGLGGLFSILIASGVPGVVAFKTDRRTDGSWELPKLYGASGSVYLMQNGEAQLQQSNPTPVS